MLPFILRRILTFIPVLILLAFFTFILSFYGPGDPLRVMMGENWDDEAAYQQLRHSYGLDRPMLVQFYDYCTDLLRGDFGRSYIQRVEVSELIWNAIPVSAQLALMAIIIVSVVGIGLGIYTGILLGAFPSRPFWNSSLLGPLFLVSGLSTGATQASVPRNSASHSARVLPPKIAFNRSVATGHSALSNCPAKSASSDRPSRPRKIA